RIDIEVWIAQLRPTGQNLIGDFGHRYASLQRPAPDAQIRMLLADRSLRSEMQDRIVHDAPRPQGLFQLGDLAVLSAFKPVARTCNRQSRQYAKGVNGLTDDRLNVRFQ